MSWWNAKYTNNNGEYEITFASKDREKTKAVEKVCCAVMDKDVKSPLDVEVVVRCKYCKHWKPSGSKAGNSLLDMEYIGGCEFTKYCRRERDFCSYGEPKEGADNS